MRKPPIVPSPCTEGGGKTAIWASGMAPNLAFSWPTMALADIVLPVRSLKSSSGKNTAPELGLLMKPLADRPGKATECLMPGTFMAMSLIWRMTASVRSSEAASGSCTTATT
jgi:hypothetical protein